MARSSSPPLFGHFAVWVTVWVRQIRYPKIRTNKEKTGENLTIFTGFWS